LALPAARTASSATCIAASRNNLSRLSDRWFFALTERAASRTVL
jgi:hypothetical protein